MRVIKVRTDHPQREQSRALLRCAYTRNIRSAFEEFEHPAPSDN